jgi:TRAP-type C4-dicarboxylate transport system permease small subunit
VLARLRLAAEVVSAGLFAVLFLAFMVQIVSRYVLSAPVAWTQELCSLAYLWVVCLAGATLVPERQHIAFDLVYHAARPPLRRVLAICGTTLIGGLFLAGLPGTVDYVWFMRNIRTTDMRLPFSWVFACFVFFLVLMVLLSALRLRRLLRADYERELERG